MSWKNLSKQLVDLNETTEVQEGNVILTPLLVKLAPNTAISKDEITTRMGNGPPWHSPKYGPATGYF